MPLKKKHRVAVPEFFCNGKCVFCLSGEDDEQVYGSLVKNNETGITAHYFCMLFSSGLWQRGKTLSQGIKGFLFPDIKRELNRGSRLRCCYCKKKGATIGCIVKTCKLSFHLLCGIKNGSLHQFSDLYSSYCSQHRLYQNVPSGDKKTKGPSKSTCSICLNAVEMKPLIQTLRTPCCSGAWFHRTCIQNQALASGLHFFKCPLCNNKNEFQEEMLRFGIRIPDQDASWELEANAFQELLERYNHCDARKCRCPMGANYNKDDTKWEIILCQDCGSQGCHIGCLGTLSQDTNQKWHCINCKEIVERMKKEEGQGKSRIVKSKPSPHKKQSILRKKREEKLLSAISSNQGNLSNVSPSSSRSLITLYSGSDSSDSDSIDVVNIHENRSLKHWNNTSLHHIQRRTKRKRRTERISRNVRKRVENGLESSSRSSSSDSRSSSKSSNSRNTASSSSSRFLRSQRNDLTINSENKLDNKEDKPITFKWKEDIITVCKKKPVEPNITYKTPQRIRHFRRMTRSTESGKIGQNTSVADHSDSDTVSGMGYEFSDSDERSFIHAGSDHEVILSFHSNSSSEDEFFTTQSIMSRTLRRCSTPDSIQLCRGPDIPNSAECKNISGTSVVDQHLTKKNEMLPQGLYSRRSCTPRSSLNDGGKDSMMVPSTSAWRQTSSPSVPCSETCSETELSVSTSSSATLSVSSPSLLTVVPMEPTFPEKETVTFVKRKSTESIIVLSDSECSVDDSKPNLPLTAQSVIDVEDYDEVPKLATPMPVIDKYYSTNGTQTKIMLPKQPSWYSSPKAYPSISEVPFLQLVETQKTRMAMDQKNLGCNGLLLPYEKTAQSGMNLNIHHEFGVGSTAKSNKHPTVMPDGGNKATNENDLAFVVELNEDYGPCDDVNVAQSNSTNINKQTVHYKSSLNGKLSSTKYPLSNLRKLFALENGVS